MTVVHHQKSGVILGRGPGIQCAATPIPTVPDFRRDGENDAIKNCLPL